MKNQILLLLEMTPGTYEKWVLNNFLLWCDLNSMDNRDCQKLLANAALFKWWYREYSVLEEKFVWRATQYRGHADPKLMREYYTDIMANIRHFYSRPLITAARKAKPVTPQYN